jgi:hypothetical protein
MIIFKRIGESFRHIEDREWLLLALETLGVLVGILLAFELQEWAANRSAAARHREIMDRLFEESEQDVGSLRELRNALRSQSKTEVAFVTELGEGRCPPEPMWTAIGTVQMLPSFNAPRSVYEELMGSGGLSSIADPRVRKSIALFNARLAWSEGQVAYFRSNKPEVVPASDKRVHLRFDVTADEPEVAQYDRAALCEDPAFRNLMVSAARNHMVFANYHAGVTAFAINMCSILGASLGRRCEPASGGPLRGDDVRIARTALAQPR